MVFIQRFLYRAQVKYGEEDFIHEGLEKESVRLKDLIVRDRLETASIYRFENQLFTYYECCGQAILPQELFPALGRLLEEWPGENSKRLWMPMMDIYHASVPESSVRWKRAAPVRERRGMLLRIRPEMLASYIFYHFQLQEEPRRIDNKYCIIGLHENVLFYYDEQPQVCDGHPYRGILDTRNTPADWDAAMEPHFIPWQDTEQRYRRKRPMEALLSL